MRSDAGVRHAFEVAANHFAPALSRRDDDRFTGQDVGDKDGVTCMVRQAVAAVHQLFNGYFK